MFDPLKPYVTPNDWTADHVLRRFLWAFEALDRIRMSIGPKGMRSNWPAYIYEFADKVAQEEAPRGSDHSEAELMRLNSASNTRVKLPPSGHEIDLMEEVFQWPVQHLKHIGKPQIVRWAKANAYGLKTRAEIKLVYEEAGFIVSALRKSRVSVR